MTHPGGQGAKATSPHARSLAARLAATRALYEWSQNQRDLRDIAADYDDSNQAVDGERLVAPDGELLRKILSGAVDRLEDIDGIIAANLKPKGEVLKAPEALLLAILRCGVYELLAHQDTDFPIIINDYMHVANAFYAPGEAKLVNAVLDAAARHLRAA